MIRCVLGGLPAGRKVLGSLFEVAVEIGDGTFVKEIGETPGVRIVKVDVVRGRRSGAANRRQGQCRADRDRARGEQLSLIRNPQSIKQLRTFAVRHAQRFGSDANQRGLSRGVSDGQFDRCAFESNVGRIGDCDWKAGPPDIAATQPQRILPFSRAE